MIYRILIDHHGRLRTIQLIPPVGLWDTILREYHSGQTRGHRWAYWIGWREAVRRCCKACPECAQYHRGAPPKQGPLQPMVAGIPWKRMSIDFIGSHPSSRKTDHCYILTAVDRFTKWAEAWPLPNKEAMTISKVLVEQIFNRFRLPLQLHSDLGNEVDSSIMRRIWELTGIDKLRTTSYKPSTNAAVERFYRTLNSETCQRDWNQHLSYVIAAYRESRYVSTGFSPNFLVLDREVWMPIYVILALWLPGKIFRHCHLVPDKFFHFSSLVPDKIFGFSLLVPDKIWPSTFPPTTDRLILFSEKSIGPMQKCCISFL